MVTRKISKAKEKKETQREKAPPKTTIWASKSTVEQLHSLKTDPKEPINSVLLRILESTSTTIYTSTVPAMSVGY